MPTFRRVLEQRHGDPSTISQFNNCGEVVGRSHFGTSSRFSLPDSAQFCWAKTEPAYDPQSLTSRFSILTSFLLVRSLKLGVADYVIFHRTKEPITSGIDLPARHFALTSASSGYLWSCQGTGVGLYLIGSDGYGERPATRAKRLAEAVYGQAEVLDALREHPASGAAGIVTIKDLRKEMKELEEAGDMFSAYQVDRVQEKTSPAGVGREKQSEGQKVEDYERILGNMQFGQ
ncbi:hypothetical protein P152DRAFT_498082, partial [Eremomyces bilateralis CBS 781.70]